jgi:hypothetical protein
MSGDGVTVGQVPVVAWNYPAIVQTDAATRVNVINRYDFAVCGMEPRLAVIRRE